MIDEFETYLENRKNTKFFIKRGHKINYTEVRKIIDNLIPMYGCEEVLKCCEPANTRYNDLLIPYILEIECKQCKEIICVKFNKIDVVNFFRKSNKNTFTKDICLPCSIKNIEEKNKIDEQKKISTQDLFKDNTIKYIDIYLNPNRSWNSNVTLYKKMNSLKDFYVHREKIADYIKNMHYSDFLHTPYWKAISQKKMKDAEFRCQICNCNGKLATHHRNYEIHGYELENMKELTVLCENCHKLHHQIYD